MNEPFWCLGHLDDQQLLESLRTALAQGRKLTALLIAHLSEVETRRLHLHASSPSLFDYCVKRLGLSEDEACRRIDVARLARRFPEIYPLLADGSLSLSVVALLKPHLDEPSSRELLRASRGLSVARVRELLASRFPRPDVPSSIRKLPDKREPCVPRAETAAQALAAPVASTSVAEPAPAVHATAPQAAALGAMPPSPAAVSATTPSAAPPRPATRAVEPLAADRFRVQLTAGSELKRKLEQCRELMRHANPGGDLAPIVERALDLLLDKLMRERFGAAQRPRTKISTSSARRPDRATQRAVVARDGLRCTWTSEDGERCTGTGWLQLDHGQPFAKGGSSTPQNVRVLCAAHNRLAAELEFGARHIQRAITARRDADPRCSRITDERRATADHHL
jgi:hypothetical protein